jgi:hypothetical protein
MNPARHEGELHLAQQEVQRPDEEKDYSDYAYDSTNPTRASRAANPR